MDSLLQTNSRAAKYHSLQGKPSPDLPPTLVLICSLYISFDLLGFFLFSFLLSALLATSMVFYDFSGIPLEALPFLMFCLKIQITALLTLP